MGSHRAMKFVLPANRAQKAHLTPHRRSGSRVVRQVASESAKTKWCPGAAPQIWPKILIYLDFRCALITQYQQMYQRVGELPRLLRSKTCKANPMHPVVCRKV